MTSDLPSGTVTFLFTDIEGSTKLAQQYRDKWESLRSRHDAILKSAIESQNGYVFQIIGDAFCAAFHTAGDALQASITSQTNLQAENWGEALIKVRMGIHTGKAEIQPAGDYHGYAALSRVQRLMSAGHGGQILLSMAAQELVRDELPEGITLRDMGYHRLKDLIHPEHIYQVNIPNLPSDFAALKTLDLQLNNLLSHLTLFIGREREIAAVLGLLRNPVVRIVTLSGAGGTGKTRLSLQVAADLLDEYEDGVWFVQLAATSDPDLVLPAIGSTLAIKESAGTPIEQTILEYLRNRHLLLVLDNFEQVVSAAPLIGRLLEGALKVKVLVTSREVLRLRGEHDYPVPTLGLPESNRKQTTAVLAQNESVALFIQHARAAQPSFELNEENSPVVAEICRKLDGLPLAIELAAARSRLLPPAVMLEKLKDRLDILSGGARDLPQRQQTMRATIDWSYVLLAEEERQLFCRLSVFSGGWTIESAEAICSGKGIAQEKILDLMEKLLDKSLITVYVDGHRYSMLETIKQYATEKLVEAGNHDRFMQRHLDYFLDMAETLDEKVRGPEQLLWLEKAKPEHDNLNSAMDWALNSKSQLEKGIQLVCALAWHWGMVGEELTERYWLEKALPKNEMLGIVPARASILFTVGAFSDWGMNLLTPSEAQILLEKSLEIWNELGPGFIVEKAKSMMALGFHLKTECDDEKGLDLIHESIEIFITTNQTWWHAWAFNCYVMTIWNSPSQDIRTIIEEEAILWKKTGDKSMMAMEFMDLGTLALNEGDFVDAEHKFQESLAIQKEFRGKGWIFQILRDLGKVYRGLDQYEQAEMYYQESIPYGKDMVGWDFSFADTYYGLGFVALHRGDNAQAEKYLQRSLRICQEKNFKQRLVLHVAGFAAHALACKKPITAARLFGAFSAQVEELSAKSGSDQMIIRPVDQKEIDHYLSICREQLDEAAFKQAWQAGHALKMEDVIQEIMGESG
jgi:predicted ATPase/class 3 adenylate cyclase